MTLEVLVATMHQTDHSLPERMKLNSDAVVVNQCEREGVTELSVGGKRILWIDTTQRGLSNSRNMALRHATADICLLADDDIWYEDGYADGVLEAFFQTPEADIIAFNTHLLHAATTRKHTEVRREAPKNKYYGSVRMAFRRQRLLDAGLQFHMLFGAGAKYGSGEESLLLRQGRQKGLRIFEDPYFLAYVDYSTSSWFDGFNEKFYFDKGAFLEAAYGKQAWFYSLYYLLQSRKLSSLSAGTVLKSLRNGREDYRRSK